jgi:hypothetical protein
MKHTLYGLLVFSFLILLLNPSESLSQDRYSNTEIGIILGEPTGISLKSWRSESTAYDAGLAWSFGGNGSVHLHVDYLQHSWLEADTGSLALYYGIGGRLELADDPRLGARIPVGLQYIIPDTRLTLFFEVAPLLDLVPETSFDVNGGLGVRFYL